MNETIYRERANGRWEYWTYADGARVRLTETMAARMLAQGARFVNA